ncbi:MAG: hypothetical protein AAGK04_03120 [Planctomycetota bacterium]
MSKTRIASAIGLLAIAPMAMATNIATDWTGVAGTTATGQLAGVSVTLDAASPGSGGPTIVTGIDLSISDFSAAPLSSSEEMADYGFDSNWTATFGSPIANPRLYAKFWRGPNNLNDPPQFEYTFDQPFTILSGFPNATVAGNTLFLPSVSFQDGILEFAGSVSSIGVISNNANSGSRQFLTFGTVPAPASLAVGVFAGLLARRRR